MLLAIGTPLPFVIVLAAAPALPLGSLIGPDGTRSSVVLVLACAVAVTSIPMITKIFVDLGILHTRFASLLLGAALIEDAALWGVVAVAISLASAEASGPDVDVLPSVAMDIVANVAFIALAMMVMPAILRALRLARWNVVAARSPVSSMMIVLLAYASAAAALHVTPVFAAFLAGFGLVGGIRGSERTAVQPGVEPIARIAHAVFIPIYIALIGVRLDFGRGFSFGVLAAVLFGSSLVALLSGALAARGAGFRGLSLINLAVTTNARGGPGIVLASVVFDAGIISAAFFTSLIITAVITTHACGAWLRFVLRRGWPLLGGPDEHR